MINSLLVMSLIAGRRCAFPAPEVESVIEVGNITPIPRTPDYISGLTAMRSQALTVIDCRSAIGFKPHEFTLDHRAIVAKSGGDSYALRVDAIDDICSAVSEPTTVPGGFGEQWARVANGLIETRVGPALLLDLTALIEGHAGLGVAA